MLKIHNYDMKINLKFQVLSTDSGTVFKKRGLNAGTTEVNGCPEVNDKILLNLISLIILVQKIQEAMSSHLELLPFHRALKRSGNMKYPIF